MRITHLQQFKTKLYRDENNNLEELHALAVEVINNLNVEFDNRFNDVNRQLWTSFQTLKPSNIPFLDAGELKPLLDYAKTIPVVSRSLTLLHFENTITRAITFEQFLVKWNAKPRRLVVTL